MRTVSEARRVIVGAIVGLLYGSLLAFISMLAAGAGHGTYVALYLSSAPLGAYGFDAGLFGAPPVWATFGALAASGRVEVRRLAQVLAVLHYASGVALVVANDEVTYLLRMLRISPEFIVVWATIYLIGQVALWRRITRRNPRREEDSGSTT